MVLVGEAGGELQPDAALGLEKRPCDAHLVLQTITIEAEQPGDKALLGMLTTGLVAVRGASVMSNVRSIDASSTRITI